LVNRRNTSNNNTWLDRPQMSDAKSFVSAERDHAAYRCDGSHQRFGWQGWLEFGEHGVQV
jgi:hypothetical protein